MHPDKFGAYFRVPAPASVMTKTVCTIGPASSDEATIARLLDAGMAAARLNTAHGDYASFDQRINTIRKVAAERGYICPIILDTKGPEIRVGKVKNGQIHLEAGGTVVIAPVDPLVESTPERIGVNYRLIGTSVHAGDVVLLDDGKISLSVTRIEGPDTVECRVIVGGVLRSNKGVNLPGCTVHLPHVTAKDKADVAFAVSRNVEFIAHSFTRSADGILEVKALPGVASAGIHVIAKIESQEGLENFASIVKVADGVMVARGDLGVEIPLERVCSMQKRIIRQCNEAGKFVITATEMLDSMQHSLRPTRAEASDVANAVFDGTDCVMLSGETAAGEFPVEAVQVMARICKEAEHDVVEFSVTKEMRDTLRKLGQLKNESRALSGGGGGYAAVVKVAATEEEKRHRLRQAFAHAAVQSAEEVDAQLIIVMTQTGASARAVANFRPGIPVLALCASSVVAAQVSLYRSVRPVIVPTLAKEESLPLGLAHARRAGIVQSGSRVLLVSNSRVESFVVGMDDLRDELAFPDGSFAAP